MPCPVGRATEDAIFLFQLPRDCPGLYQMGEVYARSWTVAGTLSGRSTPKNAASYVVQRGVGISRTRT